MTARKRREDESFEEYRNSLTAEEFLVKLRLRGKWHYQSGTNRFPDGRLRPFTDPVKQQLKELRKGKDANK